MKSMKEITIDSITLHCSTADPAKLERCIKLLKLITKAKPVKTLAKKRIPAFKIRPGLPLNILLTGISELKEKQFNPGFLSFGVKEYIEIASIPYQREIGIIGFDVVVKLKRPGFRITQRKKARTKIGKPHIITRAETIEFFKQNFTLNLEK